MGMLNQKPNSKAPSAPPPRVSTPAPAAPAPAAPAPARGTPNVNGMFKGMKDAKASRQANYDKPGDYVKRILRVKADRSRKSEDFVAVETEILHVLGYQNDANGIPIQGHNVGEQPTHMLMVKHDSFLGNMKSLIGGVLGQDPNLVDEDDAVTVCGDDQPFAGKVIRTSARNTTTRKGTIFTAIQYFAELTADEIVQVLSEEERARFFPEGSTA